MISSDVERLLRAAVAKIAPGVEADLALGPPKNPEFGDFASPVAMSLARALKKKPADIAASVRDALLAEPGASAIIAKADVANPGYLNITLAESFWHARLAAVLKEGKDFGRSDAGGGKKVLLEYVSANPTGPLHVGHARGAAVGDTVASLQKAAGYRVDREFYINDVGKQMENLGRSVWYRLLEVEGKGAFPEIPPDEDALKRKFTKEEARRYDRFGGLYRGDYIREIVDAFRAGGGTKHLEGAAMEDGVLEPSRTAWEAARDFAHPIILAEQKETLAKYGVVYDRFTSEGDIRAAGLVEQAIDDLKSRDDVFEQDGALWLRSTKYGDDKDRVVKRSNGEWTYLSPDIAYHREKLKRGYDILINAWGADHHGYIPRMRAALTALGFDASRFHIILIQLVRLLSNGKEVKMSKRSGSFVTMRELIEQVGPDAARYLMLIRSPDSGLDFDLDLAKKATNDNPVFYVQYGHARVCSVFAKAPAGVDLSKANLAALSKPMERDMIRRLARFPDEIAAAAQLREPHRLTSYLHDLVRAFHGYYSKKDASGAPEHRIVSEDSELTAARLALASGVRTVLGNGLALCGVSAPERMQSAEPEDVERNPHA